VTKTKGSFPSAEAARKLLFLVQLGGNAFPVTSSTDDPYTSI
jgi:hypothetical protein